MSKFKMKSPYDIDPVARYEVPFAPDNMPNDSGLIAKANKNGTMIVDKNIPSNSPIRKNAESHEDHHLRDMMDNKLDYDDKAVYHNLDGKGVKMVSRGDFQESDKTLPWEKDAYAAGDNLEEKDMRPNPNKLDRPPNMYEHDTPLSFVKQMGRERREQDQDKVSMSERFGMGMVKKFGCGPQANIEVSKGTDISGNEEGESEKDKLKKQAKANAEAELAKKNYEQEVMPDGRIRFSKSAEGNASETITTPGGSGASGGTVGFRAAYENADKEKYPTFEEFKIAASSYNEKIKKPTSSTSTQTATASDEYYETPTKKTPPTKTTPDPEPKKKCPTGYYYSKRSGACIKMQKQKRSKNRNRVKKTKFKHNGDTFSCPF